MSDRGCLESQVLVDRGSYSGSCSGSYSGSYSGSCSGSCSGWDKFYELRQKQKTTKIERPIKWKKPNTTTITTPFPSSSSSCVYPTRAMQHKYTSDPRTPACKTVGNIKYIPTEARNVCAENTNPKYRDLMNEVETALRTSYGGGVPQTKEFLRFFSAECILAMRETIKKQTGYYPEDGDLVEKMIVVYTDDPCIAKDPTEPMREFITQEMADKHVGGLMRRVVSELGYEVLQAVKLGDYYLKNMNGPSHVMGPPKDCGFKQSLEAASHMDWLIDDEY